MEPSASPQHNAIPSLPTQVKIVGIGDVLLGLWALGEVVLSLANHHLSINFAVLWIPAGIGILMRVNAWRLCSLVLHIIIALIPPVVILLLLIGWGGVTYRGWSATSAAELALAVVSYAFIVWAIFVLLRPDVRRAFMR
ncbi:MAG: hypothetical protein AAGK04_07560 [Planctomycetota bacterium]